MVVSQACPTTTAASVVCLYSWRLAWVLVSKVGPSNTASLNSHCYLTPAVLKELFGASPRPHVSLPVHIPTFCSPDPLTGLGMKGAVLGEQASTAPLPQPQ
ncbi:hypothetical protein E2C01_087025 [Portunus trituberculatus]|uniref:Uncharacterized protein n=1 Tax=Portunus trituberculatus TaxID=210409 RepID=A0A5B7JAX0_PORTR|nr:hypothetical protein [Portunus trituberculatus]